MPISPYDHRLSVHVTRAMHSRLTRLADDRNVPIAEIAREALREYLDVQEDVQGSKKHFTKGFHRRIDFLEWQLTVLLWVVCRGVAYLISQSTHKQLSPENLLEQTIQDIHKRRAWLDQQLHKSAPKKLEDES